MVFISSFIWYNIIISLKFNFMGKKIAILVVILLVLGVGFYVYNRKEAQAPVGDSNSQTEDNNSGEIVDDTTNPTSTPTTPDPKPNADNGGETPAPDIQVVEVNFDSTSFTPSTVTVHQNDYVFFKNSSTGNFWPASNPHPTHTIYPEFDADKAIAPGGVFKFQFTKIGTWGYHDHFHPKSGGTVIVVK